MSLKFPCIFCKKSVKCNQNAVLCIICQTWSHTNCGDISPEIFHSDSDWICALCVFRQMPFHDGDSCTIENIATLIDDRNPPVNNINEIHVNNSFPKERGLKISHLNVCSLRNKKDEVELFLQNSSYDIFSVSETWLNKDCPDNAFHIDGYNFERKDRISDDSSKGGGVGCYIRESIAYIRRKDLESDSLEVMWIEVRLKNRTPIFIGILYKKPDVGLSFFQCLNDQLDKICLNSDRVIIMGDFNVNMLKESNFSKKIRCLCNEFALSQIIKKPTRVTPHSQTLIDLILVSNSFGLLTSGIQSASISDHLLTYVVLKETLPKGYPKVSKFRSFRNFDVEKFCHDLRNYDWSSVYEKTNVNEIWTEFKQAFEVICNKHAPYCTVRKKMKQVPWITDEYLELARERDYLKKRYDDRKDPEDWKHTKTVEIKLIISIKYYRKDIIVISCQRLVVI